ncbi:hypothetical protein [Limnobaculum xujianqingii]|uniref:hypothetical protein n=1 Tax=Limnobaculum xujianqingii TaxID=2738837 RepID=UPI0015BB64DC|nr:hypothetical protein [Limnobaculum xujianqingii]
MKRLTVFHPSGQRKRCSNRLCLFVVGSRQVDPNGDLSQRLILSKHKTENLA